MGCCSNGSAVAGSDGFANACLAARRDHNDVSQKHAGLSSQDKTLNANKNVATARQGAMRAAPEPCSAHASVRQTGARSQRWRPKMGVADVTR
jgi:hypothetical protein